MRAFDLTYMHHDTGPNRPNHGRPWDERQEAVLERMFSIGANLETLCERLGRSAVSITARLAKLGLIDHQFSTDKETTMTSKFAAASTPAIEVRTKTLIHGVDAQGLTDDEIFELIAQKEAQAASLGGIRASSTKLKARIRAIEDEVQALVEFVDGR